MRRFIVPFELIGANSAVLEGDLHRHISRVLRLGPGDTLILCDGGKEYSAIITAVDNRSVTVDITDSRELPHSGSVMPITLIQGLPKGEKFDFIIQKATELGVASIIAFHASRSVVRISPSQAGNRVARWRKIAAEAARQSERVDIPEIVLAENLGDALRMGKRSVNLILFEREKERRLHEMLDGSTVPRDLALLVGPEGGFSDGEVSSVVASGFTAVSLGQRILRTETASLAIISILQYQWGDLG